MPVDHPAAHVVLTPQFQQSPDLSTILKHDPQKHMPQRVPPPMPQDATTPGRLSKMESNSSLVDMPADQVTGKTPTIQRSASHSPSTAPSPSILANSSSRVPAGLSPGILITPASAPPRSSPMPSHHGSRCQFCWLGNHERKAVISIESQDVGRKGHPAERPG